MDPFSVCSKQRKTIFYNARPDICIYADIDNGVIFLANCALQN